MLCDTLAETKQSANGCTDGLGNPRVAGTSLTKHSRKSKSAAPFPQYDRLEVDGKFAILINDGRGWLAHTPETILHNPWTKEPFRIQRDCRKAVRFWLRKGKWPKTKKANH